VTETLEQLRRCSVAVDLGSARTRLYVKQSGLMIDEPSVVAVNTLTGALLSVGTTAERMDGRTPDHIRVVRPICNGTVVDIDMAQRMIRAMTASAVRKDWRRRSPMLRAAVTVPQNADPLARRAAVETLGGVGARSVELVETPTAAGVGCGLPVERPEATMILVCGATTTQIAVLSLGSIVSAATVAMGGDSIHQAVVHYMRYRHELILPNRAVRPLHLSLTEAVGPGDAGGEGGDPTEVWGRDIASGMARTVTIDPDDVRAAIQGPLAGLSDSIRAVLHDCPPDLVADLAESGMVLAGGSAQLPGLDERLRAATGMSVRIAEEPSLCVVNGLAAMVEGRVQPAGAEVH
jgi:rod shape-determining protein MreB